MPDLPENAKAVASRLPPRHLAVPSPRVALVIAAAIVVGIVLYLGRSALAPFVIGGLLIYLLDPLVARVAALRIGRWRMPRGLAVLLVYILTVIALFFALRLLFGPLVAQLFDYVRDVPSLMQTLDQRLAELNAWYLSLDLPPTVREAVDRAIAGLASSASGFDFGALLPVATSVLGAITGFIAFLIIPIWAFYLLRDRVRLTEGFMRALPETWRDEVWAVLTIIERVFGRWIRGQIVLGLIVGGATFGGLVLLGTFVDPQFMRFAVLLAVIAGILELLPIIGPIISMIPTLLVALTTSDPVVSVIWVLVLYLAVQQIEGAVLVPKIQGDAVDLHPSLVIFALILGGAIAGLLGAILAIPITAAARDVYRYLFRRLSDTEITPLPGPTAGGPDATVPSAPSAQPPATEEAPAT